MSSVDMYVECEQCGGVVYENYQTRTFESYSSCKNCGKTRVVDFECDAEGKAIRDEDGKYVAHVEELPGFGAFSLSWNGRKAGVSGPLSEPWGGDFEAFYAASFTSGREDVDPASSYVTSFRDGKVERVWGEGELPAYDDEEKGYC